MRLRVGKAFLAAFWKSVYHSILPEGQFWTDTRALVVEPIFSFDIRRERLTGFRPVEAWSNPSFDVTNVRGWLEEACRLDESDVDQALHHLDGHVYEVSDNPFFYPLMRLDTLMNDVAIANPTVLNGIAGFCHFHPISTAEPSPADRLAFRGLAKRMEDQGKNGVVSLILARGSPENLVQMAKGPEDSFVRFMLGEAELIKTDCRRFHSQTEEEIIQVLF